MEQTGAGVDLIRDRNSGGEKFASRVASNRHDIKSNIVIIGSSHARNLDKVDRLNEEEL